MINILAKITIMGPSFRRLGQLACTQQTRVRFSLAPPLTIKTMGKIDKKRKKLQERIDFLQNELRMSLTKKTSTTAEISVGDYQRKIQDLKLELTLL